MTGAAAISHGAAVFFAMRFAALMCCTAFMMGAMASAAVGGTGCFVVSTMFCATFVGTGSWVLLAMLCADFIFSARVISAMFGAIVFCCGFICTMFQALFTFFAFVFFAMINAIVRGIGFMLGAMLWINSRCCWFNLGDWRNCWCCGAWCDSNRFCACFCGRTGCFAAG